VLYMGRTPSQPTQTVQDQLDRFAVMRRLSEQGSRLNRLGDGSFERTQHRAREAANDPKQS
jgi:hypothetical protein